MTAIVNATLLRAAASCVSTEVTRYYLQGVLIQRHQVKGVVLVATDGHKLIAIHDENGSTTLDDVIVRVDKATLAACKAGKDEPSERQVVIQGDGALQVLRGDENRLPVYMAHETIIDGTFPHWQRVANINTSQDAETACFNPQQVTAFGTVATDLAKRSHASNKGGITLTPYGGNPALIRFLGVDYAFGVLVPLKGAEKSLPDFLNAAPARVSIAA